METLQEMVRNQNMGARNQRRTCNKPLANKTANQNKSENKWLHFFVEMGHHALALKAPLSLGWNLGLWSNGEDGA